MPSPVFRFAPSPNGFLHTGHAYSALYTWREAEKAGGTVLLRIEDIDVGRGRPEYVEQIFDDLSWLGLLWPDPVRIQSEYFDDYRDAVQKLQAKGLLYPCFCSRKQVVTAGENTDPEGAVRYFGTCKHLSDNEVQQRQEAGVVFSMRLDMAKAIEIVGSPGKKFADLRQWGDVVLVRKDVPTSYHLSVVVDDALQKVSHVTRGMDMYAATAIHILLQKLLELPTPIYQHHKLIKDDFGRKLAKSDGDLTIKALRANGVTRTEIVDQFEF